MKFALLAVLFLPALAVAQAPNTSIVFAKSLTAAPGAIVCKDMDTVDAVFHLYIAHWEDSTSAKLTNGQSTLIHGQPLPVPDPKRWGCELAKPGTKMTLYQGNVVPVVSFKLANGREFRGVTTPAMLSTTDPTKQVPEDPAPKSSAAEMRPVTNGITKAVGPVPGAAVCMDWNSVLLAYREFERGNQKPPMGCTILPPGIPVSAHPNGRSDIVVVIMPDGKKVSGVTMSQMVEMSAN